jgi:hypothetical protein
MFSNNGRSLDKNLGTFTSRRALNNNYFSHISGSAYLRRPAALMTLLTALLP